MKKIFVKAATGRLVRDPATKSIISEKDFVQKDDNSYWRKRIQQGDVVLKAEVISAKVTEQKPDIKENVIVREKKDGNIQ